jgi:hypothetical protein
MFQNKKRDPDFIASSLLWAEHLLNPSEASYPASEMNGNHSPHEQVLMIGVQVWESSLF